MLDRVGLQFERTTPAPSSTQNRADIACFVGFVSRSSRFRSRLPDSLRKFLREQGLIEVAGAPRASEERVLELLQLPVPIDSWSGFTDFFEERGRPAGSDGEAGFGPSYLGAAVRSFFAQGGRKCFVVRAGDPLPLTASRSERLQQVGALLPQFAGDAAALSPEEPLAWRGISHLFALPEAAFVCLPDLPSLVAPDSVPRATEEDLPVPRETFVECSDEQAPVEQTVVSDLLSAPRLATTSEYVEWSQIVSLAASFLADSRPARSRKDVQLVVAIPLPRSGTDADLDLLKTLVEAGVFERASTGMTGLSSAHVQLAYPWIGWDGSSELPEGIEPPDGALVGMLARGTLLAGSFTNFADQLLRQVNRLEPLLSVAQRERERRRNREAQESNDARFLSLRQRVSLFGFGADGIELLSDVTSSADEAWRAASVNRLMSVWVRALQRVGEELAFEPSSELTWADIRHRLQFVGEALFTSGALAGQSAQEAFLVRCDRSTMSQSDLDSGRLIAEVQFRPAIPIEGIVIALALDEAQRISVRQVA